MSADPTRQAIEKEGLVGRLSYPSAPGTHPTVTVLGGSGGGLKEGGAAALSSEGFTALALCYFGLDPLPPKLVEIPLEYFSKAITCLMALLAAFGVAHDSDARWIDGELALLLGAAYPEDIRVVVDYVPSGVAWRRPSFDLQSVRRPRYSWPRLKASRSSGLRHPLSEMGSIMGLFAGRPMAFRPLYERWLEEHNHPFYYEHLCYKGVGHLSCPASHRTRILDHHAA